ncbi:MAG: tyrosine-type recombinase/integrase [Thaumarchaeota archaeon]|nr:tyrosine-type recombinase/integrase [Nitrososphaerota archaeon]
MRPRVEEIELVFDDFIKLESMQELLLNTRGSKYKHREPKTKSGLHSTQAIYANRLFHFHKWLVGRKFEYNNFVHTGENTFKNTREEATLEGLEHLLKLYQSSFNSERDFMKLLKKYLNDPLHEGKTASAMVVERSAIQSYFKNNESPIKITFDPRKRYKTIDESDEQPEISLDEFLRMMTVGRPSLVQKTVFICKFQRGLDSSTLVDRFNFQAWEQMVKWFGTSTYESWDLSKCPVPIKLTRMKTDFTHTGFLDQDAITSIQELLKVQETKGRVMENGKPLFLNKADKPIDVHWISNTFNRLAERSGIQTKLSGYRYKTKFSKTSHELRDLLESTLLDCGVRPDVVEHVTGHKPKDSYEKQASLYPESLRREFSKAQKRINIFTNLSNFIRKGDETQQLRNQLAILEKRFDDKLNEKINDNYSMMKEEFASVMKNTFSQMAKENLDLAEKYTKENITHSIKLAKRNGIEDIEMSVDEAVSIHNKLVEKNQ